LLIKVERKARIADPRQLGEVFVVCLGVLF